MDSYTTVTIASPIASEQVPVNRDGDGSGSSSGGGQCTIA